MRRSDLHRTWGRLPEGDYDIRDLRGDPLFMTHEMLEDMVSVWLSLSILATGKVEHKTSTRGKVFRRKAAARLLPWGDKPMSKWRNVLHNLVEQNSN
ncbi:hypothetical protein GTF03_11140 [Roseobacter sp. HKCCD7415]|uniref:hypothetical protein n=3 Tax=unclassified Roseobacter TaxID=196798 RepID=UPI0014924724|nr:MULTISPECIES: hypothetical protein [unclassified Roseobacter]MBF9050828.1 hypothetical protein [Rhodobacterales bacterium HKCCD4356]NNV12597.1 hypothetical protein [Roseobacter sp. HKCCD7357]NNV43109.1 hypothetical protein [Roseobacter sp. HKCCD6497]NNV81055.1 hypothetical protein [Roseobacter sp. HKCCD6547]NNW46193.1 hypothetical protein [Roseobacter sp. HKCCD8291]NNW50047.1 hypothetical protein [Roseobacter sp. HKCCD9144]NNW58611.1 hypothetical protein [Roseobacter sp. HKCCD8629]NNY032